MIPIVFSDGKAMARTTRSPSTKSGRCIDVGKARVHHDLTKTWGT